MKKFLPILGKLLVAAIFVIACWMLYHKIRSYSLEEILDSILHIRSSQLLAAVLLVVLNYIPLVGYDWLAVRAIHRRLPLPRVALVSFTGCAVSYNLGALLGGTTVRYRLYSAWGFHPLDIVRLVLMLAVTFWIGASFENGKTVVKPHHGKPADLTFAQILARHSLWETTTMFRNIAEFWKDTKNQ